ncbi:MAG: APC family permease [Acidimicrobiia bacterium]
MSDLRNRRAGISWPAMAFMTIAATGSIAQLSASAEYGLGAVTLYLLPALCFLLPVALIAAELATGWEGGVFTWVREGMSDRMGFQAQWLQWIQSVALYPSLLSFAAAALAYAFGDAGLATNGLYTGAVILVVFWLATLVAMRGVSTTARIASTGMIVGTAIPAVALVVLMAIWLGDGHTSNTPLAASDVVPPWTGLSGIVLIISNFIAFAGLEVNAVHVRDMNEPERGYPKALALAGAAIVAMYMLGSIAIAVMVPNGAINLNAGAAQAFTVFGTTFGVPWLGQVLSAMLVIGILAAATSWVAGPSRGLLNVGREGFLPPSLQRVNDNGVQAPILIVQGLIVSLLAMAFVFIPSVASAFWILQATTAILYLSMYVILFVAAWRLRRVRPDTPRTFRVPAIGLFATVGVLAAASAIFIAFIPPAQFGDAPVALYVGILLAGVLVLGLAGQLIVQFKKPGWQENLPEIEDSLEFEL